MGTDTSKTRNRRKTAIITYQRRKEILLFLKSGPKSAKDLKDRFSYYKTSALKVYLESLKATCNIIKEKKIGDARIFYKFNNQNNYDD